MRRQTPSVAAKRAAGSDALGALSFAVCLSVAATVADAASAPQQWLTQSVQGVEERLHPVIESHIKSQLDWRSYYLDRPTTYRSQMTSSENAMDAPSKHVSERPSRSVVGES